MKKVILILILVFSLLILPSCGGKDKLKVDFKDTLTEVAVGDVFTISFEISYKKSGKVFAYEKDNLVWVNGDKDIIKVENGTVTALKGGKSAVTVKDKDDLFSGTIFITVKPKGYDVVKAREEAVIKLQEEFNKYFEYEYSVLNYIALTKIKTDAIELIGLSETQENIDAAINNTTVEMKKIIKIIATVHVEVLSRNTINFFTNVEDCAVFLDGLQVSDVTVAGDNLITGIEIMEYVNDDRTLTLKKAGYETKTVIFKYTGETLLLNGDSEDYKILEQKLRFAVKGDVFIITKNITIPDTAKLEIRADITVIILETAVFTNYGEILCAGTVSGEVLENEVIKSEIIPGEQV